MTEIGRNGNGPLRVLMVNKYYYRRGGAEYYMLGLSDLLGSIGVDVVPFAMHDARNLPAATDRYFASHVDFEQPGRIGAARCAARMTYSLDARRGMRRLLDSQRVDIAHVHNLYHQLSPSVLAPIRARGIPIVMTVHDFKLVCPAYNLMSNGQICDRCVGGSYVNAVTHRCNRGSLGGSILIGAETWLHDVLGLYRENVDIFLTPSRFARDLLIRQGYPSERIEVVPNFVDRRRFAAAEPAGDRFLYAGRLSEEKGADVLIRAVAGSRLKVSIAGSGPDEERLRSLARALHSPVEFLGQLDAGRLAEEMGRSRAVVLPSRCIENCPLVVLEAFAAGRPVVASAVGGVPELVTDGENGLLVPPGDADSLRGALDTLGDSPELTGRLGEGARRSAASYAAADHVLHLLSIYERAAGGRQAVPA